MLVSLGHNYFQPFEEIVWDSSQLTNGHWLVLGATGSGKTTFLKRILHDFMAAPQLRVHVFDTQGDIELNPAYASTVKFSEASECGVNPFQLSAAPDFGGVRRRINSFIQMLNRYGGKIGQRQEAVLRTLLYDLYESRGFLRDNPATWHAHRQKRYPTMADLKDFTYAKLKKLALGDCDKAIDALDSLSKKTPKLYQSLTTRDKESIETLKSDIIAKFTEYVRALETGKELDSYISYDSKETLKSTYLRIDNMCASGVFKNVPPLFEGSKPIWRYDIRSLSDVEQCYLIELYLEKIFFKAKQEGLCEGPETIRTYIVIDEAQKVISSDPDHIINVIARQARKFGLAFCFSSQSHKHFTDDIIISSGTKVLLGIDALQHAEVSRKFGINEKRIKAIEQRSTALIHMKACGGYNNNNYMSVKL